MHLTRLLKFILVTLPLTNSVTLPVGFPLKLYEVVGFLALGALFIGGSIHLGRHRRLAVLWGAFFFGSMFASAWGMYQILDLDLSMLEWAHGRFHPVVNTVFHYAYLAFDIGLLMLVVHVLENGLMSVRTFVRFWLYGTLLSVIYAVALNLATAAGLPPVVLLRWDELQFMNVLGVNMVRTGPFEEGNYFGLYLVASVVLAAWGERRHGDRFFRLMIPVCVLGAVMTASPAALLGVLAIIGAAVMVGRTSLYARLAAVIGGLLVLAVLVQTGLFKTLILDKFSLLFVGGVTDVTNVSLIQRLNESYHAWLMFLDHPLGIGMGNYGYFYGQYPDLYVWLVSDFANIKHIANNVYLEVLSEHGLIVFSLFIYTLIYMMRRLLAASEWLLAFGLALICVYFLAFPTFRLSLIWVFWGLLVYLGADPRDEVDDAGA